MFYEKKSMKSRNNVESFFYEKHCEKSKSMKKSIFEFLSCLIKYSHC